MLGGRARGQRRLAPGPQRSSHACCACSCCGRRAPSRQALHRGGSPLVQAGKAGGGATVWDAGRRAAASTCLRLSWCGCPGTPLLQPSPEPPQATRF